MTDRADLIEAKAIRKFCDIFQIPEICMEPFEKLSRSRLQTRVVLPNCIDPQTYYTPDYIYSENFENSPLEELCFIDVNEPAGTAILDSQVAIAAKIDAAYRSLRDDEATTVNLTPPGIPIREWVLNKIRKVNESYANNRDKRGLKSPHNGVIHCMGESRRVYPSSSPLSVNYSGIQFHVLIATALWEITGGLLQYSDIDKRYRGIPVAAPFSRKYKNLAFVCFFGDESEVKCDYVILNEDYVARNCSLSKHFRNLRLAHGGVFRKTPAKEPENCVLDIMKSVVSKPGGKVFPYGNVNYQGSTFNGLKLEPAEKSEMDSEFEEGFQKKRERDAGEP